MSIPLAAFLIGFQQRHVLVYGPDAAAVGPPRFGPPVYVRPGYWLVEGGGYLLPVEAIDDVGQRFLPPECYSWIEQRGDQFPRADVIGTLPSGAQRSVFMKELDLAELAVFASPNPGGLPVARADLVIQALAVPGNEALAPIACPPELELFARALPCYRLAPGVFGAVGAAILSRLLATGRRDWRLTYDELDDAYDH